MVALMIEARDGATNARAGRLHTAHGDVRTPAFVPLATKATVKGLLSQEVKGLGYDMVLGNTFHLMLNPGAELIERFGGLHGFMDWDGLIVTDSGGFQVFSMGHGTIADEIKARPSRKRQGGVGAREATAREATAREGAILSIEEQGVRFRSYVDGAERFLAPEDSMAVQASLHSDIALVFDECTPFHVDRDYTERSTERTHRWLTRCLDWHAEHGPSDQLVYGSCKVACTRTCAAHPPVRWRSSGCDGVAIGGSLGAEKAQMYAVVGYAVAELGGEHEQLPRHLLGIGDVDDLIRGVELGIDTFDCAIPTRLGRHGTALVPDPATRWRVDLTKSEWRTSELPLMEGWCLSRLQTRPLARLPLLPGALLGVDRDALVDRTQPCLFGAADGRSAPGNS